MDSCGECECKGYCARCSARKSSVESYSTGNIASLDFRTPIQNILGALELLEHSELTPKQTSFLQIALTSSQSILDIMNRLPPSLSEFEVRHTKQREDPKTVTKTETANAYAPIKTRKIQPFARAIREFFEEMPLNMTMIDTAISDGWDKDLLLQEVQYVHSCASSLPAIDFVAACQLLQDTIQSQGQTLVIEQWDKVKREFDALRTKLSIEITMRAVTPPQQTPLTVLIGDDDRGFRLFLRDALENENFRIIQAENGEDVIDACIESPPDIVLLDIKMPLMDGFSACREILKLNAKHNPVILMMSSFRDDGIKEKSLDAGATDFIEKPINACAMVDHVTQLVKHHISCC